MSWLSTSLSENLTNITGQISTFTKDMLTEGTVEVDDPGTELKIAKARLRELELTLYTQREEYERVKELNHELQERAEAAELQISSISREYRTLLQDKENDLTQIREQLELQKEHIKSRQERERLPSFNEESFVGGSSHEEVQYLKAVISKLQDEKKEWMKNGEKENLHKELDHYQHELATLHSTYSQRIALLNKNHKEEIQNLEESQAEDSARINELEQQLEELKKHTDAENSEEIMSLKKALETSEETVNHLNQELDILRNNSAVTEESFVKCASDDTECAEDTIGDFQLVNKQSIDNEIEAEQGNTESVSELKLLIDRLEREKKDLVNQRDQAVVAEQQTSASLESLKEELSRLAMVTMELMKEVEQSQGVDNEKTIEIESLKKLCLVKKSDNKDDVIKLKNMLAALWTKYAAVVLENEEVRLEMNGVKQRLLSQLQDRHGDTKSLIDGLGGVRNKLEGTLEGQRQQVRMEKEQLEGLLPEVENNIEEQEECVTRLQEENEQNNKAAKDIVSDIGKVWTTDNHVASLHAEKAVLEGTIVGLEAKVEKLERLLENSCDEDTPRSSVSTVISVGGSPVRAAPDLSELGENGNGSSVSHDMEESGVTVEPGPSDDVNVNEVMMKLKEYEEMIQEFELIKEDWEGEKEALENVLMDLRKRLKDALSAEKSTEENSKAGSELGKDRLNELQELLLSKNYLDDQEVQGFSNDSTRVDVVLGCAIKWLKESRVKEPVMKQENQEWSTALEASPGGGFEDLGGLSANREDSESLSLRLSSAEFELNKMGNELEERRNELDTTKTELGETANELNATKNELSRTNNDLDETRNELSATKTELGETANERTATINELSRTKNVLGETRSELDLTKTELHEAIDKRAKLEATLKFLEKELEESHRNVNSALSEKDEELHKLRYMVEQLQGTLSNFENDKNNDIVELEGKLDELRKDLREAEISYETLAAVTEEKGTQLDEVMAAYTSLETGIAELRLEKEKLVDMVNERDERIEELQDKYDSIDERASFLREREHESSRAYSEVSEECSLLKEEKSDLFGLLETKDLELNKSLRETEKLSELLRQQEVASEVIKKQNAELAQDLERWRVQMDELNHANESLSHDLDAKVEEILTLKENNIELLNQSYENTKHDTEEVSQKLSMLEELVSENSNLKSEKVALMEALSQKENSEKELKDSYNLILREKQQFEMFLTQGASDAEKEVERRGQEVEVLRLEVARLTREVQEKEATIRTAVSSTMVSGDASFDMQQQVRRILEEKDVEIAALRTKNESLLAVFADNEQENARVREEHEKQIRSMLDQQERMLNEINEKSDQMVALEDRLEMMRTKSDSKDQATALIHGEYQKLLRLNESQAEEIGKLREKASTLGVLVAEKDHGMEHEAQRLYQRNGDLQKQVDALQREQERLLMLVHEKDKQLSRMVHEVPLTKSEDAVTHTAVAQNEYEEYIVENKRLSEEIVSLEATIASLSNALKKERGANEAVKNENSVMTQQLLSYEVEQTDSGDRVSGLQHEVEKLREALSAKEREISVIRDQRTQEINRKDYEINTLKNEKDEILLEHGAQNSELRRKLSTLLDVVSVDEGFNEETGGQLEDRQDFQRLLNKIRNHRARLLTEKENELKLVKEQLGTLSSVQNISNTELEKKLEQFIQEKDEMNRRLIDIENENIELVREKENDLDSLQTQIVDLSSVLQQKEREWAYEKERLNQENVLMDNRVKVLHQDKSSLLEVKTRLESEATRSHDEIMTLKNSVNEKHDVILNEKDRRVKEVERDLEDLKQRYSKSLQEAQNLKSSLDEARENTKEFESKKEKQLERLRSHLLQVEESYTQEALASEEREKDLKGQLDRIQEQLLSSSHSLQDTNRTASIKMENLQEQLMSMTAHRDEVLAQLEESQEQTLQATRSVENLQMVLEQFQREKDFELRTLRDKNNEQLNDAEREVIRLRQREVELKQLLDNASDALNKADKLGEDLRSKEEEIETLKVTVSTLETDLQSSHDKLRRLSTNSNDKIEKSLMKNMLLAYFNTAEQKRADVVAILGHILCFTEEEIKKVGSGSQPPHSSGWFSGLLSYGGHSESHQHDKTFSELFVSFLEKESENNISAIEPPTPSSIRTITATMAPARIHTPPVAPSPLAASTPHGNSRPISNPLLINTRMDGVAKETTTAAPQTHLDGNPLLGSTLRPSLDLPTITNSSSSSSALRQILFNN